MAAGTASTPVHALGDALTSGMAIRKQHVRCLAALMIAAAAIAPAAAQKPRGRAAAVEPYQPVAVTRPAAPDDPTLQAFRQQLTAVARKRVYAQLTPLVQAQGFFWARDFGNRFDARKPAVDSLAAALSLERANGDGWNALVAFAADATASPLDSRPGIICAPAEPQFDGIALDRLIERTRTDDVDWMYVKVAGTPARASARPNAPVVETLGLHFVRYLGMDGNDDNASLRTHWVKVATPGGKQAYVAPNALLTVTTARLCYGKDHLGRWTIAGFVGAGD